MQKRGLVSRCVALVVMVISLLMFGVVRPTESIAQSVPSTESADYMVPISDTIPVTDTAPMADGTMPEDAMPQMISIMMQMADLMRNMVIAQQESMSDEMPMIDTAIPIANITDSEDDVSPMIGIMMQMIDLMQNTIIAQQGIINAQMPSVDEATPFLEHDPLDRHHDGNRSNLELGCHSIRDKDPKNPIAACNWEHGKHEADGRRKDGMHSDQSDAQPETQDSVMESTPLTSLTPLVEGLYAGEEVQFIHTEASDPDVAQLLTEMMGPEVVVVPELAEAPSSLLANVYVFTNGIGGSGLYGFQPDVVDAVPGDVGYRPLRAVNLITWQYENEPRQLNSVAEIEAAADDGEIEIEQSGAVVNMPILVWSEGQR